MGDNEDFFFGTDNDINAFFDGTYFRLQGVLSEFVVSVGVAGVTRIFGGLLTTDDLVLKANIIDDYPQINLLGNADMNIYMGGGASVHFWYGANDCGYIYGDATNYQIGSMGGRDVCLLPEGAAYVKFGTYDATAALASTGFIAIKDAAGNVRKLMVQA